MILIAKMLKIYFPHLFISSYFWMSWLKHEFNIVLERLISPTTPILGFSIISAASPRGRLISSPQGCGNRSMNGYIGSYIRLDEFWIFSRLNRIRLISLQLAKWNYIRLIPTDEENPADYVWLDRSRNGYPEIEMDQVFIYLVWDFENTNYRKTIKKWKFTFKIDMWNTE